MNIKTLAIAAAMTLTSFAANAATLKVVYTGTVTSSYVDGQDLFGVGSFGSDVMNGLAFTATYIYDTDIGYAQGSATSPQLYGYGATSPVLSAVLTINGVSVGSNTPSYGTVYRQGGHAGDTTDVVTQFQKDEISYYAPGTYFHLYMGGLVSDDDLTLDLDGSFDAASTGSYSNFQMYSYDPASYTYPYSLRASFDTTNVTVSAVPIPASLPLLAAALGGFGIITRRRKKAKRT